VRRNETAPDQEGGAPQRYANQDERDRSVEPRYTLGCDCCRSLLMAVSCHREELLAEYMAWAHAQMALHVFEARLVREWMEKRFGAPPYPAARGVMLYTVKVAVFGDPYAYLTKRAKREGTGVQDMPRPRLSNREWNDARNAAAARERDLPPSDRSEAP
jgi:hypothetical protein